MENKIKKYLKDAGIADFVVNHEDHNSDWKMLSKVIEECISKINPSAPAVQEDQLQVLREMLELTIKSGRRMYHDYCHIFNQLDGNNEMREIFEVRIKHWRTIFYPDDGPKDYRTKLRRKIDGLEDQLEKAKKQLNDNGITFDDGFPF